MNRLKGKIAIVTGASRGIGEATAKLLAEQGVRVYGTSRKINSSGQPHERIATLKGGFFELIQLDVNDSASINDAISLILKNESRIDILVNNAGFGIAGSVEDTSIEEAKEIFDTNFFGAHRMIKAVLPHMRSQHKGVIIIIGSVMGLITMPYQAFYSSSKYALESMSEALRMEVKTHGIKVSLVEPGDTKTGFSEHRKMVAGNTPDSVYNVPCNSSVRKMANDEANGVNPISVARIVCKIAGKNNPPIRVVVGFAYKAIITLKRLVPERLFQAVIYTMYKGSAN